MVPTIPADAPAWVPHLYWIVFAVVAAVFAVLTPRLRAALATAAPPPVDTSVRMQGAILGAGLDATKVAHELDRIADALEGIQSAVQSLARSEEAGQARMLQSISEKLERLDRAER